MAGERQMEVTPGERKMKMSAPPWLFVVTKVYCVIWKGVSEGWTEN